MALKQSSLQRVFILPFVLLMICLAATIGWVLYRAGEDATDTLSRKALVDMIGRIDQATERHLLSSEITLNTVAPEPIRAPNGVDSSVLELPADLQQLENRLWIASGLFADVNRYVYFGGEDGRFIGVNRVKQNSYELRLREPGTEIRHVYSMSGPGQRIAVLHSEQYDPRLRPWYVSAVQKHMATWSSIYTDFVTREPILTLAKPVYRQDQSLVGVVATDLSLQQLSRFLQSLTISKNGVAFIAERSGALIATSANETAYRVDKNVLMRLDASESALPLVRDAYRQIREYMRSNGNFSSLVMREFDGELGKTQVAATALRNTAGLDWMIVVAVPRSDFLNSVTRSIYQSLSLGLLAMLIALVFGFVILQWALRDIRKLTHAAKSIGHGEPLQPLDIRRGDEIGQLAHSFQEMERNLRTDRLTRVLNRDALLTQIEFRLRNATPAYPLQFALLFIDLDNFKFINDYYGHESGDRVLVEVAARLQGAVRKDDAVARFGGDEFVVYLHGVDSDGLVHSISEKIRTVLEEPIQLREGEFDGIGASIGAARYPSEGEDVDTLLSIADTRMFQVKKARKAA